MSINKGHNGLVKPPEAVINGDSIPLENQEDELIRVKQKFKELRVKRKELGLDD